ncbi:MAG: hydroxyethylthiazole kinase [Desulfobacterales bacterium]
MPDIARKAAQNLELLRRKKPLVHNITNLVVMNVTANALLAMGASPIMAHAQNEVEQVVSLADALVLNIGTLSEQWMASMLKAGSKASQLNIPVVLDPVGAGATTFRTSSAKKLVEKIDIRVIRGNPSEILSLRYENSKTKGVDSFHTVSDAEETARLLARELKTTLAVTGPTDFVTDGIRTVRITNGHTLMGCITGSGCMATAIIASFLSIDSCAVTAASTALSFFGLAGEIAGNKANGPGTFMVGLFDALYNITPGLLEKGAKIFEN